MAPIIKTRNSDGEIEHHGYEVNLCDPKAFIKYQCPLCKHLIRDPIQTERGELACEYCYNEAKRDDGKCPIDREPLENKEFRDKGKEKDILKLACYCYFNIHGCCWKGELRILEAHLEDCEFKPINCQLCHQEVHQSNFSLHLDVCPEVLANGCTYKGCPYKAESVEQLKQHLQNDVILHAYLHSSAITDMQQQIITQSSFYENTMKEKDAKGESEMEAIRLQMSEMAEMMKTLMEDENKNNEISKLEERIHKLEQNKSTSAPLQTDSCNGTRNPEVERLSNEVNLINKNFADLDLRQQLFENTSYNGKLIWKIDDVTKRLNQAVVGRVTALHSAPTFTHRNGYKFCARLYLNGDGVGKGSHVSLFFVLMKSEYDSLLTWPFTRQVKFKLINQGDDKGKCNIDESFMPDRNSSSFSRPKKDMNIASGCPKFIKLDRFKKDGFIKDDCIFIEVQIVPNEQ